MDENAVSPWDEITLSRGQEPFPVPVVTSVAPVQDGQALYVTTRDCLYAITARDGVTRWRREIEQAKVEMVYHPMVSYPPPPRMTFSAPRVVNGSVYVCMACFGAYSCAFNAEDGSLRWRIAYPTPGASLAIAQ